jgi:hypothetical protein
MLYSDMCSIRDTNENPAERLSQKCVNCGHDYHTHYGWSCAFNPKSIGYIAYMAKVPPLDFNQLLTEERYLTQSMIDSLASVKVGIVTIKSSPIKEEARVEQVKDISDWRAWAHNIPGECKCGMQRSQCDYHR